MRQRLLDLISTQLGVPDDELVPEARILDDLGADSLDVVELVMALEESFDITVPDEDVEALATVADVTAYVERRTPPRLLTRPCSSRRDLRGPLARSGARPPRLRAASLV